MCSCCELLLAIYRVMFSLHGDRVLTCLATQVELKKTKRIYAMKVIKKDLVMDEEDIDWVQTEKHVFEQASNHPFLVGLHSCFQTESRYMCL